MDSSSYAGLVAGLLSSFSGMPRPNPERTFSELLEWNPDSERRAAVAAVERDFSLGQRLRSAQAEGFSGTAAELAEAVVDFAVGGGMSLEEVAARPWAAVRLFEEITRESEEISAMMGY